MAKEIWINLPVKNLAAAREFYTQAGFLLHEGTHDNENMAGFIVEDQNVRIMLFQEETLKASHGMSWRRLHWERKFYFHCQQEL